MPRNVDLLEEAAAKLGSVVAEVVFVGGSVLDLLITDTGAAPVRVTVDVDVVANIATYKDYIVFSERLRLLGFSEDRTQDAPVCRWRHGDLRLDVMPVAEKALGFSNIWYSGALTTAQPTTLPNGAVIQRVAAPYFLGTKMEAFRGRGRSDFFTSHDLEDFVAVVEGRETICAEISESAPELRDYLADATRTLLHEQRFLDALPGYLLGDFASQSRASIILERLAVIAGR